MLRIRPSTTPGDRKMCRARNVAGALELGDAGQKLKPNDRVLFIIGRGGGGHKAAARAVAASMKDSPVEIETIDAGYVIEGIMCNRPPRTSGFDMDELYNIFMRHGLHGLTGFMGILARMLYCLLKSTLYVLYCSTLHPHPPSCSCRWWSGLSL
jgi:hypothetical protein